MGLIVLAHLPHMGIFSAEVKIPLIKIKISKKKKLTKETCCCDFEKVEISNPKPSNPIKMIDQ